MAARSTRHFAEYPQAAAVITGDAAVTLDGVTLSASGIVVITGSLAGALDAMIASSAGTEQISGGSAGTLDGVTLSATGGQILAGTLNVTLDALAASSSGGEALPGAAAGTLDDLTLSATGSVNTSLAPASANGGLVPLAERRKRDPDRQPIRYVLHCLPLRIRIVVYPVRFEVRKAQRKTAVMRAREELGLAAAQTQFASRESLAVNSLADDLR